jgi:hypothetical protein
MTLDESNEPQAEDGQFSGVEIWTIRGVMAAGVVLLLGSGALLVLAGFYFGWRTIPSALVYGALPLTEGLVVASLLAMRRPGGSAAAIWLCNLLNVWLIYHGAIGL